MGANGFTALESCWDSLNDVELSCQIADILQPLGDGLVAGHLSVCNPHMR